MRGCLRWLSETGELSFREAPDYEAPGDVESAEPASGAGDNEYIVVVEVSSGEGERQRKGSRAVRVRVTDEEEPPEITGAGVFEVVENRTRVGQLEAVDPDEGDEIRGYGIAGGADAELFAIVEETGELSFRQPPDYENPGDVASDDPQSGAGDNEYIVVVEVWSGEGERERRGRRAIRVRVSDEEEPPEIIGAGVLEVVENRTRVGRLEAVDPDEGDEITGIRDSGGSRRGAVCGGGGDGGAAVPGGAGLRGSFGCGECGARERSSRQRIHRGGGGKQRRGREAAEGEPCDPGAGE